jgi:hypothetical protein
MIHITNKKVKKVNNNLNVVKQNVKNCIIRILHFIIIVKRHIMVNFHLAHYLIIKYLKDLLKIEAGHVLRKVR